MSKTYVFFGRSDPAYRAPETIITLDVGTIPAVTSVYGRPSNAITLEDLRRVWDRLHRDVFAYGSGVLEVTHFPLELRVVPWIPAEERDRPAINQRRGQRSMFSIKEENEHTLCRRCGSLMILRRNMFDTLLVLCCFSRCHL